ncbi:MAG: DUF1566 domain-containing protein [Desulfatirhabdiaceae bacterium]
MNVSRMVRIWVCLMVCGHSAEISAFSPPDTSQTLCYSDTGMIICPSSVLQPFFGQDSNYTINPKLFTKLDANGNVLSEGSTSWVMVKDNVTGLIWEAKTNDGTLYDKDNTYGWENAQTDYIAQLNINKLGGFSDWRLPTVQELAAIVNRNCTDPAINTGYFLNTLSDDYWSSTLDESSDSNAWVVDFKLGNNSRYSKSLKKYVRAVRKPLSPSFRRFVVNNDGTVTDNATGLMWHQTTSTGRVWEAALAYCENDTHAGFDDWRLPNIHELQSLLDYQKSPAIDQTVFLDTLPSFYWSSTTYHENALQAWIVDFKNGLISHSITKSVSYYIRPVRAGQKQIPDHFLIYTPSQGQRLETGTEYEIKWNSRNIGGNVAIHLSRDGGKNYEQIVASTVNDGNHAWIVTGPSSYNCMLKIEPAIGEPSSRSTTQGLFRIMEKGDVNGDLTIDLTDAILCNQVLIGNYPNDIYFDADVNGDDKIGMAEAIFILETVANLSL